MEWIIKPRVVPGQPDACVKNMCSTYTCVVICNPYICGDKRKKENGGSFIFLIKCNVS